MSSLSNSDRPFMRTDRENPLEVRLRRNYPIKSKKTPSIREVREVKEVRDDRPACFVILFSWELKVGPPDVNAGGLEDAIKSA